MRSDVADGGEWGSGNGSSLVPSASSAPHQRRPHLAELVLLEAMVKDAARCVQESDRGLSHQPFVEAYEWIASNRRDWPFSFLNVCEFLGIDATAMRRRLGVTDEYSASASLEHRLWRTHARMRLDHVRERRADGGSQRLNAGSASEAARTADHRSRDRLNTGRGLRNRVGLLGAAALLCLGACQRSEGPLERAGKAIDETVEDAGDKMREAGHEMEHMADGH